MEESKMSKRTAIKSFPIILAAAVSVSCNLLDTYPRDGIGSNSMWTTEEHVNLGVTAVYGILKSKGCYSRNPLTDAYTQYAFIMSTGFDELGQRYFCYNTATTSYGIFSSKWNDGYEGVQYANLAIANIPGVDMDEDAKMTALAEVRFLRALYYFDLLSFYSGHKNTDKGIPLYSEMPDYDKAYLPRATPADVRALMIEDLEFASAHLPFTSYEKGRANAAAAMAMLGKVYLYADLYEDAVSVFEALIARNDEEGKPFALSADYASMFTLAGENNPEYVFAINFLDTYGNGSYIDLLYNSRSANCAGTNTSIPTTYLADAWQNRDGSAFSWSDWPGFSWDDEAVVNEMFAQRDPRLEATIIRPYALFTGKDNVTYQYRPGYDTDVQPYPCMRANNGANDYYCWRKFCNTGNETTIRRHSPTDLPLIRWADVLLLYAEALNEARGPVDAVYNAVDQVRSRAGMPPVRKGSREEVRQRIRDERVYELAGEGHLYPDFQRWYAHDPDFDYETLLNHTILSFTGAPVSSQAGTRVFTARNWCYAIPQEDIDLNPALEQAQGWNN